jgi:hypothetical protein
MFRQRSKLREDAAWLEPISIVCTMPSVPERRQNVRGLVVESDAYGFSLASDLVNVEFDSLLMSYVQIYGRAGILPTARSRYAVVNKKM